LQRAYSGAVVTVSSVASEPEEVLFDQSIRDFEAWTGIDVQYSNSRSFEIDVNAAVEAQIPADLIVFPQPGLLRRFVQQQVVVDISTFMHPDWLRTNYDSKWLDLSRMEGITAGI
jgi:alpha-glucoside transport system substrate-binding protein